MDHVAGNNMDISVIFGLCGSFNLLVTMTTLCPLQDCSTSMAAMEGGSYQSLAGCLGLH